MSAVDDENPPEDYVEDYLNRLARWGKAGSTIQSYQNTFNYLQEFLEKQSINVDELSRVEANDFITWILDQPSLARPTAVHHLQRVSRFYSYYSDEGFFEVNPLAKPLKNRSEQLRTDRDIHHREISIHEMGEFIRSLEHPFDEALLMMLAKTGKRISEISNLDVRDVNIDHPGFEEEYPELRTELEGHPDTIYFASSNEVIEGKETNGEVRQRGNKSKKSTLYPIDSELKQALLRYFAIRPPSSSPANPLFLQTNGTRATRSVFQSRVKDLCRPYGWHSKGDGYGKNVTPHYFRSWWGTNFEPRVKDRGIIKYLRGDSGDIVDHYRENYGKNVRKTYLDNIYKFYQ